MSTPTRAPSGAGSVRQRFYYQEEQVFQKPFEWQQTARLLGYLRPYAGAVVLALVMMALNVSARLAGPYLVALAIDTAIQTRDLVRLNWIVAAFAVLHVVGWMANGWRIRLVNGAGQRALNDLRHALFAHVQNLSQKFFDGRPAGSILVRITNDVNSLQDLFTNGIISLVQDLIFVVAIVFMLLQIHTPMALICLIFLPFMVITTGRLRLRIRRTWQMVRIKLARINAHLSEAIQGVRVTQAFVQQPENQEFFDSMNDNYRSTWMRAIFTNATFRPVVEVFAAIGTMVGYWYGTRVLQNGELTVGQLVAFVTYLGQFWEPIQRLTEWYAQVLVAMASSERIFEFMDIRPTVAEPPDARQLPRIAGRVELDNVVFEYEPGRRALDGVSLDISPGETIALVGHTGAGKTSIINLISRFYDPTAGAIRIDGHDLRAVTLASLRTQVGVVLQDTFMFDGTVMDNIRFGRLEATDEEVMAASRAVGAHEFIARMPEGYLTEVKERGSRLSMGERQLLSFARALLADPRILILDEATSAIDTRTELMIQEALRKLLDGRTAFVIAHRLSTIRGATRIVVLDHGRVVEMGTHPQLMQQRGVYYDLLQAQFKWLDE